MAAPTRLKSQTRAEHDGPRWEDTLPLRGEKRPRVNGTHGTQGENEQGFRERLDAHLGVKYQRGTLNVSKGPDNFSRGLLQTA
jgi:hypothetical protein